MREAHRIAIAGAGAVSAAGWGLSRLFDVQQGRVEPPEPEMLTREGRARSFPVLRVPKSEQRHPFARHPRMRRTSVIGKYAIAASLEALGEDRVARVESGNLKLGVILSLMNGCVNFSNRFYGEVLANPATASPILFPETVFNAPSSHLSAYLGSSEINYTLVGDSAQFLQAVDMAVAWLGEGMVDGCLVVGAEEVDWLSAEGLRLFSRSAIASEGAGALYLESRAESDEAPAIELERLSDPVTFLRHGDRLQAMSNVLNALGPDLMRENLHLLSQDQIARALREDLGWSLSGGATDLEQITGHSMGASVALQSALGYQLLQEKEASKVMVLGVGHNQQCCGAIFGSNH